MNSSSRATPGIELLQAADAAALLADESFRAEWLDLQDRCPWATAFQAPVFVVEWYRIYGDHYQPVLIVSRDVKGQLTGLLPLAVAQGNRKLKVAGGHQAEYQAWICLPAQAKTFPRQALDLVRQQFPSATLQFRYLPAAVPLGWLADPGQSRMSVLKASRCPFMKFGDGSDIEESLRKSGNKSRLRQLKKLGEIEFVRITNPTEFAPLLDDIARYHDCRQLASHGSTPFLTDRLKKSFHLALMNAPGLLHMTVLKVGGQIASAHLNIIRGKEVQLFLIAHNPMLARLSPGKLHILFLARMLKAEGFEQMDLTPGGEEYKDRFANAADTVHTLIVCPTATRRRLGMAAGVAEKVGRRLLTRINLKPARVVYWGNRARSLAAAGVARTLLKSATTWLYSSRETRVYGYAAAGAASLEVSALIRRDCLDDLLTYRPTPGSPSRQEFLGAAMERLEAGQHVYTYVQGDRLIVFGWLAEDASEETLPGVRLPPRSAAVLEFQTFGKSPDHDLSAISLKTMLRDAARIPGLESIFIALPNTGLPALDAVKAVGFSYQASLFQKTRLGRRRQSVQMSSQTSGVRPTTFQKPVASNVVGKSSMPIRPAASRRAS
jgi:CelD/BcsL family acetyltransferase involved in cellulose biosynthesis